MAIWKSTTDSDPLLLMVSRSNVVVAGRCLYAFVYLKTLFLFLVVMATDIMDKDLGAARKARWEKAFNGEEENKVVAVNRKATIVLEHLMQASDVAHTMQHWNVFKKWNERLFCEMYQGYVDGRSETDPSKGWYQGEKGFFDYYIIPLARKLETCGVFGVSSAEYLNYALKNRAHWEHHGEQLVQEYLERFAANSKQVT